MSGTTISHYRILAELGRGGMGIVYRALDERLDREVALKVLPAAALSNADDRARFYREARAAASLTHPHIAVVHEIDEAAPEGSGDTQPFIAMELIDGESLGARIKKGPLKLDDAVRIASEIASGLDAAHEKGIVHRDIKASNVMLTAKDEAKILDFGLAQTSASTRLTRQGATVGTVAYMSPEQARGETLDARTDLWSLGVVLYEIIAGRHPFPGDYDQAVLYEILNQDPEPLTGLRTGVPMELERIVAKCLSKDSAHRYQHADELLADLSAVDLTAAASVAGWRSMSVSAAPAGPAPSESKLIRIGAIALATLVIGFVAGTLWQRPTPIEPGASALVTVPLSAGYETSSGHGSALAVSPDGRTLVFRDGSRLWRYRMEDARIEVIPGTEGAEIPMFSPDGSRVAFVHNDRLKVASESNVITELVDDRIDWLHGGDWPLDDRMVVGRQTLGIWLADIPSRSLTQITNPLDYPDDRGHAWPQLLDGGTLLLYTVLGASGKWDDAKVYLMDIESRERWEILSGGSPAVYLPSGHLAYTTRDSTLYAAPFDLASRRVGTPEPQEHGVLMGSWGAGASYAVSHSGTLVMARGTGQPTYQHLLVDRGGTRTPAFPNAIATSYGLGFDSSGTRVLTSRTSPRNDNIGIINLTTGHAQDFTSHPESDSWPLWSPDEARIAWVRFGGADRTKLMVRRADRTDPENVLYNSSTGIWPTSWTPDGKWILVSERRVAGGMDLRAIRAMDSTYVLDLRIDPSMSIGPMISPDGRFMAFDDDGDTGARHAYVTGFPLADWKIGVPLSRATNPRWSLNSNDLFVWSDSALVSVRYRATPDFAFVRADTLFTVPEPIKRGTGHWTVHPDGQHFLIRTLNPAAIPRELEVVVNWSSKLPRGDSR